MLISEVNKLGFEDFTKIFGNVIEMCPSVAAAMWPKRPFTHLNNLQSYIDNIIDQFPSEAKAGILRCLPDLAGRLAEAGDMSDESKQEQKAAGLDTLTSSEKSQLDSLNKRYKEKFGFPFVICARENKKDAILKGLAERLSNTEETEIATGIAEVKKICRLRLANIVTCIDINDYLG